MQLGIVWIAEAVSQRESGWSDHSGWPHFERVLGSEGEQHRRDADHFDFALNRNDRAMAKWSASGKNYCVGP